MKKIKLCGVSLCTLLAATGANAAGYTCEELIEYTSCMPGYYLNAGDCIEGTTCGAGNYLNACPEGWTLYTGYCGSTGLSPTSISELSGYTYERCAEESAEGGEETYYLSSACGKEYYFDGETLDYDIQEAGDVICTPCSAGTYQPSAGQYSCMTCPAGSDCPTTGLSTATVCESGEYSNAGATACSTCLPYSYTNASGQTVTAPATSDAGAAGITACYIDPDTYFTDVTGTWHFKESCRYDNTFDITNATEEEKAARCEELGGLYGNGCYYMDAEGSELDGVPCMTDCGAAGDVPAECAELDCPDEQGVRIFDLATGKMVCSTDVGCS